MSAPPECLEIECWEALRAARLAPDEEERCARHLTSGAACQVRLVRVEEGEDRLLRLARQLCDPTVAPPHPKLTRMRARLDGADTPVPSAPAAPAHLVFIHPATHT